jgi:2-succinyl-6-hydroxy-2,4-cyclohexadiene-1-carboxylate synthase
MKSKFQFHYSMHGRSDRPAILFLHGFMGSSDDWSSEIIPTFASDNFCITVDLPGHGRTVASGDNDFHMDCCAARLIELLDNLSVEAGRLVGYSMGGRLGLYLLTHYPGRFTRAVIESASPGLRTQKERDERIAYDERLAEKLFTMPIEIFVDEWYGQPIFASLRRDEARFRMLLHRRYANDPHGLARSLRLMGAGTQPSLWEKLGTIQSRLLVMAGFLDAKYVSIGEEIADTCRSAVFSVIDGAGHNAHFENRSEFVRQVRQFLQ